VRNHDELHVSIHLQLFNLYACHYNHNHTKKNPRPSLAEGLVNRLTMSVSAVASLRPLRRRCWQHPASGLLSVQLRSRTATVNFCAIAGLRSDQRRFQTSNSLNNRHDGDLEARKNQLPKKSQPTPPQITFRQFAGRALAAGLRSLAVAMSPTGIKTAFRQSPGATTLGIFM
jgi:hypothetical protein